MLINCTGQAKGEIGHLLEKIRNALLDKYIIYELSESLGKSAGHLLSNSFDDEARVSLVALKYRIDELIQGLRVNPDEFAQIIFARKVNSTLYPDQDGSNVMSVDGSVEDFIEAMKLKGYIDRKSGKLRLGVSLLVDLPDLSGARAEIAAIMKECSEKRRLQRSQ